MDTAGEGEGECVGAVEHGAGFFVDLLIKMQQCWHDRIERGSDRLRRRAVGATTPDACGGDGGEGKRA